MCLIMNVYISYILNITTMKKLALNMIVKNEAHIIQEVLQDICQYIDYYVICDTGSTDNTIEVIRSFMLEKDIEGEIYEVEWKNFGYNRSQALQLCQGKAEYCWVIDADDRISGNLVLPELHADTYLLRYGKDFTYWRKQIFRVSCNWKYIGVLHEYADSIFCKEIHRLEGSYYISSRRLGNRNKNINKYLDDVQILLRGLEEEPNNTRYMFYLAQSFYDAKNYEQAYIWYKKRVSYKGWEEAVYYSLYRMAECQQHLGKDWEKIVLPQYLQAYYFRKCRMEPLYKISKEYRLRNDYTKAYKYALKASKIPFPENDTLFLYKKIYDFSLWDEFAIISYYVGKYKSSLQICNKLLSQYRCHKEVSNRLRIEKNRSYCIEKLKKQYIKYPSSEIEILKKTCSDKKALGKITFTMTTCKRKSLFQQTLNSFIQCCTDIDLIKKWIIIDDNSSSEDRLWMQEKYPFIQFHFKSLSEKGHVKSMNLIINKINTPFWFHLEDDWLFFEKKPYLSSCLEIMEEDVNIKQVMINRNYMETPEERSLKILGGKLQKTTNNSPYYLHQYIPINSPEYHNFLKKNPNTLSNINWPHYSLRPSLIKIDAIHKIGNYKLNANHFELEYALRFQFEKYQTAFLYSIFCIHIGKLSRNWNKSSVLNAYQLNQEKQFNNFENLNSIKNIKNSSNIEQLKDSNIEQSNDSNQQSIILPDFDKIVHIKKNIILTLQKNLQIKSQVPIYNNAYKYQIVLSITTCKRLNLFIKTMNYFIYFCKDLEMIQYWYLIDDNSSEMDRKTMQQEFPFFQFIHKTPSNKGHVKSINWIWKNVNSKYLIHLEDDWKFTFPFYIKEWLSVLIKNNLQQLLCVDRIGKYPTLDILETHSDTVYSYIYNRKHIKKPTLNQDYDRMVNISNDIMDKRNTGIDDRNTGIDDLKIKNKYWWWPGFSLNPSILDLGWFTQKVGYFNPIIKKELFEYDYALRTYYYQGKIGFIRSKNGKVIHTGKQSSYILNDAARYYEI